MITENKYGVHIIILVNFNLDNILTILVKHFIKKFNSIDTILAKFIEKKETKTLVKINGIIHDNNKLASIFDIIKM